jgi:hypothetical protein
VPAYYYSSTAGTYTLTGAVSASATILVVNSVTGLPTSTPFKVVVEPGQPSEEIVKVTAVAGTSLTVVRGWDGTSGATHAAAVEVRHMVTAEDFTLSRAHEDATVAHGAIGAVVGTTNAQTISNKDLGDGTNTFPSSLATLTGPQALTNKDLTTDNTFPNSLATLDGAQTLTNKTLDGASNTFSNIPSAAIAGQCRIMERSTSFVTTSATEFNINAFQSTTANVGAMTESAGAVTVPVAGVYAWGATAEWAATASTASSVSRRRAYIRVNDVAVYQGIGDNITQSGESLNIDTVTSSNGFVKLNAGDKVNLAVYQSTGVSITCNRAQLSLVRVA